MRIDVFCLIHLGKVNLEKELLFGMLPLLSPCVTSTLSLSPSQPRASLNPGHRALARVVPTGVISLRDCLWPGRGKPNRNDLSAYRAEITARCRGTRLEPDVAACRGAGPITGAGFSFTLVPTSEALEGCSDRVCAKGVLESSRKGGYFPRLRLFLLVITEGCFKVLK